MCYRSVQRLGCGVHSGTACSSTHDLVILTQARASILSFLLPTSPTHYVRLHRPLRASSRYKSVHSSNRQDIRSVLYTEARSTRTELDYVSRTFATSSYRANVASFCGLARLEINPARPYTPLPHLRAVISFLTWLCRTKIGRIDPKGKITLSSLETYWRNFKLLIQRRTGMKYSLEDQVEINKVGMVAFQSIRTLTVAAHYSWDCSRRRPFDSDKEETSSRPPGRR